MTSIGRRIIGIRYYLDEIAHLHVDKNLRLISSENLLEYADMYILPTICMPLFPKTEIKNGLSVGYDAKNTCSNIDRVFNDFVDDLLNFANEKI